MNNLKVQENNSTSFSLTPRNLQEALEFAKILASSSFVPPQFRNKPHDVLVCVQYGAEIGIQPIQALQNISVINSRPCIWGDLMLALVLSHPDFEDIQETDDGNTAKCVLKRKNMTAHTATFSIDDAKIAHLFGKQGSWTTHPFRMRQMRARGFAIRNVFADALKGIGMREEIEDYEQKNKKVVPIKDAEKKSKMDFIKEKLNSDAEDGCVTTLQEQLEEIVKENWDGENCVDQLLIDSWLDKAGVDSIFDLSDDQAEKCIQFIKNKLEQGVVKNTG